MACGDTASLQQRRRLFDETPVDDDVVRAVVAAAWPGAALGTRVKTSQNVTYKGTLADGSPVAVRATATEGAVSRIEGELAFVRAAVAAGVCSCCEPIEPGHAVSADGNTVVVVSRCVKPTVAWLQLLRWLTCADLFEV